MVVTLRRSVHITGLCKPIPQKHKPVAGFKDSNQFINQYKQPAKTKGLRIQAGEAHYRKIYKLGCQSFVEAYEKTEKQITEGVWREPLFLQGTCCEFSTAFYRLAFSC